MVDLGAPAVEVVDEIRDGLFVSRDEAGGEDHRITRLQLDLLVVVHGDAGQGTHGLSLGAGGDHADLLLGELRHFPQICQDPIGDREVAQLPGDSHVGDHGAPVQEHLPAAACCRVNRLLHPVDVAGEGGHDNPPPAAGKNLVEGLAHHPLGEGVPFPLHVGGVGQERQYPFGAIAGKGGQVGQLPVHRGLVDLEVAGVDHHPLGGGDRQGAAVDDGVGDPDELDGEAAEGDRVPRLHHIQIHVPVQVELFQLLPHEAQRQCRAVEGRGEFLEDEGKGTDMVLVTMGEEDAPHLASPFPEVGDVWDDQVDAEHVRLREHQAAVDHDDIIAVLVGHHVQPDLPYSSQRNDAEAGMCEVDFHAGLPDLVAGVPLLAEDPGDPCIAAVDPDLSRLPQPRRRVEGAAERPIGDEGPLQVAGSLVRAAKLPESLGGSLDEPTPRRVQVDGSLIAGDCAQVVPGVERRFPALELCPLPPPRSPPDEDERNHHDDRHVGEDGLGPFDHVR